MLDYASTHFFIWLSGLFFLFFKGLYFFVINDDITFNQEPFTGLLNVIYE